MTALSTRQTIALVLMFVATSLTFIQLDNRRALDPIKTAIEAVVSPVTRTVDSASDRGGDSALERELAVVKAERDRALAENAELKAGQREMEQLRLQARLQQEKPAWKMLQARVVGSDPTGQQLFMTIDKGSRDGIEEGMAVVAQGPNYVGQVSQVWDRTAKVMLIIDSSQTVGATLEGGADGVVYGLSRRGGWLDMRHLDRDEVIAPGELVLTNDSPSLRTSRVPGGLIIGRADTAQTTRDPQADSQTVQVVPQVNYEKLQVVTVVLTDGK
ncbi:MAG: rod shape-determining protein MreC [Chloroflexota bacterium]